MQQQQPATEYRAAPTYLATLNAHPRDKDISFEEEPHIYTVLGERDTYTSVTTFLKRFFEEFDEEAAIYKIMLYNWKEDHKYYGMTAEDIKAAWSKTAKEASEAGTYLHNTIENYFNELPTDNDSVEFGYFHNFRKDYPDLKPYRTEWMVYDEEVKICGSIDMIFENPDGTIQIYDWKRTKDFDQRNAYKKWMKHPLLADLPDTTFYHYAMQLNMYKYILEKNYGKQVTKLCLVRMYPAEKNYERVEVPDLQDKIRALMEERKQSLA